MTTHAAEEVEADEGFEAVPSPMSGRAAAARLLLGVGAVSALFVVMGWGTLLLIILAIIAMVLLHEFGHYITAKRSGMKVTEFFVGFGPRLWSVRKGETEYGVKAIPAGGYCRIIGMTSAEEVHPSDEPRAYRNQAFYKRIIVASAGSAMHILIAFVLAFSALLLIGRPDPSIVVVSNYLDLGGAVTTPAQEAGIQPGDHIVAVDGHKVTKDTDMSRLVHRSAGKPIDVTVERSGTSKTLVVTPLDGRSVTVDGATLAPADGPARGYLGVSLTSGTSRLGPLAAIAQSGSIVKQATTGAVTGIVHLFSPSGLSSYAQQVAHPSDQAASGSSAQATQRPESIIGAVRTADQAAHAGILPLIEVFISLNIFIGVINMLPMLPLDGGHVVIAGYEWARTRRGRPRYQADVTKMMPVVYAFLAFLLVLVSTSMYLDIAHPAANPFR